MHYLIQGCSEAPHTHAQDPTPLSAGMNISLSFESTGTSSHNSTSADLFNAIARHIGHQLAKDRAAMVAAIRLEMEQAYKIKEQQLQQDALDCKLALQGIYEKAHTEMEAGLCARVSSKERQLQRTAERTIKLVLQDVYEESQLGFLQSVKKRKHRASPSQGEAESAVMLATKAVVLAPNGVDDTAEASTPRTPCGARHKIPKKKKHKKRFIVTGMR